jgi:hypothetical protein
MAPTTYSVTLHHLAPGAKAAGLGYVDEQLPSVTPAQLVEMLHALNDVASSLTIYEPSSPEIRIKTDREVFVVRTRYRRLCFVGREGPLRGEEHSIAYIMATVSGLAEPVVTPTVRTAERPASSSPHAPRNLSLPSGSGFPDWAKVLLLAVISLGCIGGGIWMLVRPAHTLAPKFTLLSSAESGALLSKVAGEYRTGVQEGDRRLIIGADGTLRIAKYGPSQAIAEEVIRTARGASQGGQPGLATSDPYLMLIRDADSVVLYGQTYKRVAQ